MQNNEARTSDLVAMLGSGERRWRDYEAEYPTLDAISELLETSSPAATKEIMAMLFQSLRFTPDLDIVDWVIRECFDACDVDAAMRHLEAVWDELSDVNAIRALDRLVDSMSFGAVEFREVHRTRLLELIDRLIEKGSESREENLRWYRKDAERSVPRSNP